MKIDFFGHSSILKNQSICDGRYTLNKKKEIKLILNTRQILSSVKYQFDFL